MVKTTVSYMSKINKFCIAGLATLGLAVPAVVNADIDRNAVSFVAPKDIKFVKNAEGTNEQAVLFGDPAKPGPYVIQLRWLPGNMSRPHFHPNDRFFVVLEGTWWLGTGTKFDPDSTVPVGPGTYVYHKGGQVHYDGAKDKPVLIQVWGMGPATSTPAEVK